MSRLDDLVAAHGLGAAARGALDRYLALLAADDTAPTTVRARGRAVDAHVADALSGLAVPELRAARDVADLGAGAGVPGLVLAAALPGATVHAIESAGRKCAFLERAVEAMGLRNVDVVHARAEEWAAGLGSCDVVTARALAPLPVLVEYAAPLLRDQGVLVAWKGTVAEPERRDGDAAAAALGLALREVVPVTPFPGADRHTLTVYVRVGSAPNGYPRRPGMASKRPIRASTRG